MIIKDLRNILRRKFSADTDRFQIIKEVAILIVTEESVGQEFVLRLLARIGDFQGMEPLIYSLVRQVGLFPYVEEREFDISSMQLFCFYQLSLCSFLASLATDCMQ